MANVFLKSSGVGGLAISSWASRGVSPLLRAFNDHGSHVT